MIKKQEAQAHTETQSSALLKALDKMEGNRTTEWVTRYAKELIIGFTTLLFLIILVTTWTSGNNVKAEEDYAQADNAFVIFQQSIGKADDTTSFNESYATLQKIMAKRPALQSKYQAVMSQLLISHNLDLPLAIENANATLKRTKVNNLTHYADYAAITLLITQGNFQEAAEKTATLNAALNSPDAQIDSFLQGMSLLRYAVLQQQLANREAELAAWENLKAFTDWDKSTKTVSQTKASQQLLESFTEGQVSLINYIEARQKKLNV